jgi:hypothetical protein
MPGIFPDHPAPVARNADGERELVMMRWGMPPPPKSGGPPVTNIRNSTSPHRRAWLKPENRCLVPVNSYAKYAPEPNPATGKKEVVWFALHDDRPLFENLDRLGSTAQLWLRADNRAGPKQRRQHDSTCKNAPPRPLLQYSGTSVAAEMRTTLRERPMGLISQAWTNLAPPGADGIDCCRTANEFLERDLGRALASGAAPSVADDWNVGFRHVNWVEAQ